MSTSASTPEATCHEKPLPSGLEKPENGLFSSGTNQEKEIGENDAVYIHLRAEEPNKFERQLTNVHKTRRRMYVRIPTMNALSYRLLFSPRYKKTPVAEKEPASNSNANLIIENTPRNGDVNSSPRSTSLNVELPENGRENEEESEGAVQEQSLRDSDINFRKVKRRKLQIDDDDLSCSIGSQESADRDEGTSLNCSVGQEMGQECNGHGLESNGGFQIPTEPESDIQKEINHGGDAERLEHFPSNEIEPDDNTCAPCPSNFETEAEVNACSMCKFGGELLSCYGKGCKKKFHISCLGHDLVDIPLVDWYCFWCVNKKVALGVHSVSDGVESIWDIREVVGSNCEGSEKEKQYFVKYKGLAHIHNRWVSEQELLDDDPSMIEKSNLKNQWKSEWTMPHRMLQKRVVRFPKMLLLKSKGKVRADGFHVEWLVKWRGLGYECATWEVENFLDSSEAQNLMKDYESRCNKVKANDCEVDGCSHPALKLFELPAWKSCEANRGYMSTIKELRARWRNKCNCVIFDEHDRVAKIALYILSFQSRPNRPFLIIAPSATLAYWEAEFSRFAPGIALVTYSGSKSVRELITRVEFYTATGCVLLHVLLSPPDLVVEDLEELESLRWDAVIIDECNKSRLSKHFQQLKILATDFWLVLVSEQVKDHMTDFCNLLPFVVSYGIDNLSSGLMAGADESVSSLKEKMSKVLLSDYRLETSRFIEFWVPLKLSDVQLEQYCATLLANFMALRSFSKIDTIDALRDILILLWKCCDHPYSVDIFLQTELTKGFSGPEVLDFGIKASGKLKLLDYILPEIKLRGLRVLILFQSIRGSARDKIGDILEDFMHFRFGPDSYERVDGGGFLPSKKQSVLKKFNDKNSGRFVFLLEKSACSPSIKLTSVGTVIIFDSDWNPMNDFRALQKIVIDCDAEPIKVFRLFSPSTVEEKVLVLAKKDITPDSSLQNISAPTCHMFLMWGAAHLFKRLEEFHQSNDGKADNDNSDKQFQDLVHEFLDLLHQSDRLFNSSSSLISRVAQNAKGYCPDIVLPGELEVEMTDETQPQFFWAKLLDGRQPRWKLSSWLSQRSRKRGHHFNSSPREPDVVRNDLKKMDGENVNSREQEGASIPIVTSKNQAISAHVDDTRKSDQLSVSPMTSNTGAACEIKPESYNEGNSCHAAQKLHVLLKSEVSKLCEVLQFSDNVKATTNEFLDYVLNNHLVNRGSDSVLQAFRISTCWVAATILNIKIDHQQSLALAREHLDYCCIEEEADYIYAKLILIKDAFLHRDHEVGSQDLQETSPVTNMSTVRGNTVEPVLSDTEILKGGEPDLVSQLADAKENMVDGHNNKIPWQKQHEDVLEFNKCWEEEKMKLEHWYKIESGIVRSVYGSTPVGTYKLKMLESEYSKKMEQHRHQVAVHKRELEAMQLATKNDLKLNDIHDVGNLTKGVVDLHADRCMLSTSEVIRNECLQTLNSSSSHGGNAAKNRGKDDENEVNDSLLHSKEVAASTRNSQSVNAELVEQNYTFSQNGCAGACVLEERSQAVQDKCFPPSKSSSSQCGRASKNSGQDNRCEVVESLLLSDKIVASVPNSQSVSMDISEEHSNLNQHGFAAATLLEVQSQAIQNQQPLKSCSSQSGCATNNRVQDDESDDLLLHTDEIVASRGQDIGGKADDILLRSGKIVAFRGQDSVVKADDILLRSNEIVESRGQDNGGEVDLLLHSDKIVASRGQDYGGEADESLSCTDAIVASKGPDNGGEADESLLHTGEIVASREQDNGGETDESLLFSGKNVASRGKDNGGEADQSFLHSGDIVASESNSQLVSAEMVTQHPSPNQHRCADGCALEDKSQENAVSQGISTSTPPENVSLAGAPDIQSNIPVDQGMHDDLPMELPQMPPSIAAAFESSNCARRPSSTECQVRDPLSQELSGIMLAKKEAASSLEKEMARLALERDKELNEAFARVNAKYQKLSEETKAASNRRVDDLDRYRAIVLKNKALAEAVRLGCFRTGEIPQRFGVQPPTIPSPTITPHPHATQISTRALLHGGVEIRAPAPHLQPFVPSPAAPTPRARIAPLFSQSTPCVPTTASYLAPTLQPPTQHLDTSLQHLGDQAAHAGGTGVEDVVCLSDDD